MHDENLWNIFSIKMLLPLKYTGIHGYLAYKTNIAYSTLIPNNYYIAKFLVTSIAWEKVKSKNTLQNLVRNKKKLN